MKHTKGKWQVMEHTSGGVLNQFWIVGERPPRIAILNLDDNEEEEYMLVAEVEADFSKQKISVTSPIGKALLGHKQGDVLSIQVPSGTLRYEILSISR